MDACKKLAAHQIDGLVQERRNSIANAMELPLSCTNPSKCNIFTNISLQENIYVSIQSP